MKKKRKRCLLLTFNRAYNYGAILQMYALYKSINKFCECEILDYEAFGIKNKYKFFCKKTSIKGYVWKLLMAKNNFSRNKGFKELYGIFNSTKKFVNIEELKKHNWDNVDYFCVGSDQVWNLNLTGYDKTFFLGFNKNKSKNFSYAASLGMETIDEKEKDFLKKELKSINKISVREKTGEKMLTNLGYKCDRNIDPVFLLNLNEWEEISESTLKSDYILVYIFNYNTDLVEFINNLAIKTKLKVFIIKTSTNRKIKGKYLSGVSPKSFLGLFKNAKYVVTNTFHGLAFSVVFNKNFYVDIRSDNKKGSSRLSDFMEEFNLCNRIISDTDLNIPLNSIDYEKVNEQIEKGREKSFVYLRESLNID